MNDDKKPIKIGNYLEARLYEENDQKYNVVEVMEDLKHGVVYEDVRAGIETYFKDYAKTLGGNIHIFDIDKVSAPLTYAFNAILQFNKIGKANGYNQISIINCELEIYNFLERLGANRTIDIHTKFTNETSKYKLN